MSSEFLNFILALTIILIVAKASGYLSVRLGQPSVLGELLAGILLGPTLVDILHRWLIFREDIHLSEEISLLAEIGVILLMMLAGLELNLSDLLRSGKVAAFAGTLGVILPLAMGAGVALLFGLPMNSAIFIGLTLSATSVSISAQTLLELDLLRTRVGLALLGAAVFDDVLVILALSIATIMVTNSGGFDSILITIARMVGYLVGATAVGILVLPRLAALIERLPISQGLIAFSLVSCLLFAWSAEVIGGMAAITGAFLLGLFLGRLPFREEIEQGIITLAYGFFVPIFFVNIGLAVDMRAMSGNIWVLAVVITAVAIFSKIVGCGLGARLAGFSNLEAFQLGVGMVSRGEVGLIVATFALAEGLISQEAFSVVVFMVIAATLVTPPMLRAAFAIKPKEPETAKV
ncbi:MAG: cation:proton antiporter [Chloroflexi bacterium]|nr:cation:proton antiporter [Chloroflexota bacterium]